MLVAGGDLEFGGRRIDADTVQYTSFDHNDANNLQTAVLTPGDPLYALNQLAAQVRASGIHSVSGEVVIDDRMFQPYRVPNGNLLITPMMVNENMVDVTAVPTAVGHPATVVSRPVTPALTVKSTLTTAKAGTVADVELSENGRPSCIGKTGCSATISGVIPVGYQAQLSGLDRFVGTFRVEDPSAFARTAFIQALERQGVSMTAAAVAPNPAALLPAKMGDPGTNQVASYPSAPFAQTAQLVLKVSLNQGANLSLSLFGLTKGQRTIQGALAAERSTVTNKFGVNGNEFDFPTNGSGSPDSKASPKAIAGDVDRDEQNLGGTTVSE
ncbi:MAG: D-alanyl-D-alanine carboxypeptidase [Nakamurella sp.]